MSEYTLTFPEAMQALIEGKTIEEKTRLGYLYQYRKVVYRYRTVIERRYSSAKYQNENWTEWESLDFVFGGFQLDQKFRTIEN